PASYNLKPNVLTVTAIDQAGKLGTASGRFSNYGLGAVDLAAPGIGLEVLSPRSDYLQRSGTDLAAAHVAGAAALLWQKNPAASAGVVKDMLLRGARRDADLAGQITEGRVLDIAGALN
ncbi:MAG: peptidase, partial [Proteobacteria bacterium]